MKCPICDKNELPCHHTYLDLIGEIKQLKSELHIWKKEFGHYYIFCEGCEHFSSPDGGVRICTNTKVHTDDCPRRKGEIE